jgi:hypothetical protein
LIFSLNTRNFYEADTRITEVPGALQMQRINPNVIIPKLIELKHPLLDSGGIERGYLTSKFTIQNDLGINDFNSKFSIDISHNYFLEAQQITGLSTKISVVCDGLVFAKGIPKIEPDSFLPKINGYALLQEISSNGELLSPKSSREDWPSIQAESIHLFSDE